MNSRTQDIHRILSREGGKKELKTWVSMLRKYTELHGPQSGQKDMTIVVTMTIMILILGIVVIP